LVIGASQRQTELAQFLLLISVHLRESAAKGFAFDLAKCQLRIGHGAAPPYTKYQVPTANYLFFHPRSSA
jgi:hypothetical protein